MVGKFKTLKEIRKYLREEYCQEYRHMWDYPVDIYEERDGSFSIEKGLSKTARFIEAVSPVSGRRFEKVYIQKSYHYRPKGKIQKGQISWWMW